MSRNITISCVTAAPLALGPETSPEEAVGAEIAHWEDRIRSVIDEEPDLIVLPEAADRPSVDTYGNSDRLTQYAVLRGGQVRDRLAELARTAKTHIAYSALHFDSDRPYNATEFIDRSGEVVGSYSKNHLTMGEADDSGLYYSDDTCVIDLDFGRVGAAICFDLNFEELRDKYRGRGVEVMVFSSEYHGGLMQNYWAYSLRSFLAASIRPPAPSAIVSPLGETIAESTNYFSQVTARVNLDYALAHLDGHWDKLAAMKKKYREGVNIHDPGRLGSVLITVEAEGLAISDLLLEFEVERLDDYLDRAREHRTKSLGKNPNELL